jgi:DNA-binding winged helix-turn-helix (wHTH) protein/tetratricopeptide (TPR) repeat protein
VAADKHTVFEFGDFRLDAYGRRLLRRESGEPIVLTGKVFDTLLYMVEHRGETLDKDRLLRSIWPGQVVEENNLTQNVSTLRHVLGETRAENRFIATIPRRGYRFVADVTERDGSGVEPPIALPASSAAPFRWRSMGAVVAALLLLIAAGAFLVRRHAAEANPLQSVLGGTQDPAVYLLYNNGRYALSRSDEAGLDLAIDYFEKAIARDPQFALAYSRLAETYTAMGVFGMRAPADTFPLARDAVLKALRLEPRLAPAYAILGHIKLQYDRDWDGAEADFTRAIGLDPTIPEPRMYRGALFVMRGDLQRGFEDMRAAQELEPLLTVSKTRMGSMFYFARRYAEAEQQFTESLALDDRPGIAHRALGRLYLHTGRYPLAMAEFARSKGITPGSYADVANVLALSGRRAEALAELDRVLKLSTQRYVSAVDIAAIYASLDDADQAVAWLDRALEQRASTLGFVAQNPAFDPLHHDPRFAAIVARIGAWKKPLTP